MLNKQMKAFGLNMRDSEKEGTEEISLGDRRTSQNCYQLTLPHPSQVARAQV